MTFTYAGPEGPVSLELELSEGQLTVGAESYPCDGRFVWLEGRRVPFWAHRDGDQVRVWLDGEAFTFSVPDPRQRRAATAAAGEASGVVKAQMPGKILTLAVKPGDSVSKGQNLLVMESMKMELALNAPLDGTVAAVDVQVGDMVNLGQALVKLET